VFIFSPFDNLIIQRKKLSELFNFDYQIEFYVPASKRKYGYFCLPVFIGNQAVARIDCKADRKAGEFIINSIHYEKGIYKEPLPFQNKLKEFATFNGCRSLIGLEKTVASNKLVNSLPSHPNNDLTE
jgi:uncharacterized protein YcaQ